MVSARRSIALLGGMALLVVVLASCSRSSDWVTFRGDQGRGATSNAVYPPFGIKWKLKLQEQGRPLVAFNPPVIMGNTIYFGSADGNFYALDLESGFMNWVFKTGGPINSVPVADSKHVYFGSEDGNVYAVNRKTGKEAWHFDTGNPVRSSIVRYGDSLLFTSDGGNTYVLSPEGVLKFKIPNPVWYYDTFQVFKDVIYFAPGPLSNPNSFGAYDLHNRAYLWVLDTAALDAYWYSFPALKGNLVFFSTASETGDRTWQLDYYAYNRTTGQLRWRFDDTSRWGYAASSFDPDRLFTQNLQLLDYMAPSVWHNLVIYASGDTVVRAFHAHNGTVAWEHSFDVPTSSAPTVAGDRVYLGLRGDPGSPDGPKPKLVCLSARNGSLLWEMDLDGTMLSAPVISGKWIVFGTDQSYFYVLEELY